MPKKWETNTTISRWLRVNGLTLKWLERTAGVAYATCYKAVRGQAIEYAPARAISDATNGAVTIDELCAPKKIAS